ncbi:MAG: DNA gyrase inhibitor YacG [Gammaproteobacteria bacterium]|nr:DNA gyrase inhibitor YacG [Gammaproteobacteria bacterium]MDH5630547.1 DNA gyrase inhibitor YacG [Gammaproteobacteria bacterium]
MKDNLIISCPSCKKSLRWKDAGEFKPFCSKRCQLIDLGEWASEGHAIPGEKVILPDDESDSF